MLRLSTAERTSLKTVHKIYGQKRYVMTLEHLNMHAVTVWHIVR